MYENISIFQIAGGLARHTSARQTAIAGNIANADTPGYRAKDIAPFDTAYRSDTARTGLRHTRPGHLAAGGSDPDAPALIDAPGPSSPNGNTVSLEIEMMKATEVRQSHELALSVYQTSLGILRTSLGRGR
jgi:flagellar basal-body rod protein FlgB